MSQYPHVWDTTCDDPFNTGTQGDAKDTGAETEEMEEVPTPTPLIRADKFMGVLDREQAAYKVTIGFCDLWDTMSTMLAQLLEILQAHGLMERSDERFLSAQDLVQLDGYLAAYDGDDTGQRSTEEELRAQIRALEERIDDALAALE